MGGGRYDGLSQTLGGPLLPAVGFAAGIERLALLVDAQPERSPDVVLVAAEQSAEAELFGLGCMVRDAGFSAVSLLSGNMGKKDEGGEQAGRKICPYRRSR